MTFEEWIYRIRAAQPFSTDQYGRAHADWPEDDHFVPRLIGIPQCPLRSDQCS